MFKPMDKKIFTILRSIFCLSELMTLYWFFKHTLSIDKLTNFSAQPGDGHEDDDDDGSDIMRGDDDDFGKNDNDDDH